MRHLLRYYRHSGSVIYTSKLPSPSVLMPCNYPILQSRAKGRLYQADSSEKEEAVPKVF